MALRSFHFGGWLVTASAGLAFALSAAAPSLPAAQPLKCFGRPATIVRLDGEARIRGTDKADVIVTGPGDDRIDGGAGNDRICTGAGSDAVEGDVGADMIEAGGGADVVSGGLGSDLVRAGPSTDQVRGNRGNDRLFGEDGARDYLNGGLGDDAPVSGGAGDFDQVVGAIGNDNLYGGPGGGDMLRGEEGGDLYDGGAGAHDLAAYSLAGHNRVEAGGRGVTVDLDAGTAIYDRPKNRLTGIEDVSGTPFHDVITGDSAANDLYGGAGNDTLRGAGPDDRAFGGSGSDLCEEVAATDSCGPGGQMRQEHVEIGLAPAPASSTLTVIDREPSAEIGDPVSPPTEPHLPQGYSAKVSYEPDAWLIEESPLPLEATEDCVVLAPGSARCPFEGQPDSLFIDGSRADDRLEVDHSVPAFISSTIKAEGGSDTIVGGQGDDFLEGWQAGLISGRGGDDALNSGSLVEGGPGSDLLLPGVCNGAAIDGGDGIDSVSFDRGAGDGVIAELGGVVVPNGFGSRPAGCSFGSPTELHDSIERIEGSSGDDVLIGDDRANTLLGRGGEDVLRGKDSDDILVGGGGRDRIYGNEGFDRIYGQDGLHDRGFSCGASSRDQGVALLDPVDPPAVHCRSRN